MKEPFLDAVLVLNTPCNLRCRVCPNWGDKGVQPANESLTPEQLKILIPKLNRSVKTLLISSHGEPLLYPHIETLLDGLSDTMEINILTNGLLYKRLKPYFEKITGIYFSLHGGNPEEHDAIVGKKGAFENAMKGAEEAKSAGVSLNFNLVINRINAPNLDKTLNFLLAAGADNIRVSHMLHNPGLQWVNTDLLPGDETASIISAMKKFENADRVIFFPKMLLEQVKEYYEKDKYFVIDPRVCGFFSAAAEISMLRITGAGNVGLACLPNIGNILNHDFEEIIFSEPVRGIMRWYKDAIASETGLPGIKCSRCCFNKLPDWPEKI